MLKQGANNPCAYGASPVLSNYDCLRLRRGEGQTNLELESRRDGVTMAHTYASNFIHCIFSTKERKPLIAANRKTDLYAYIGGIARNEGFSLVAAGGTVDHVHLLFILPPTQSLATTVQKLKGSSSHWMGKGFSWQEGYGAFSYPPRRGAGLTTVAPTARGMPRSPQNILRRAKTQRVASPAAEPDKR